MRDDRRGEREFPPHMRTDEGVGPYTICYWKTWNFAVLESVPPGVTTCSGPVVAAVGMTAVISESDTTLNVVAAVPLKVTLVLPVKPVPRI